MWSKVASKVNLIETWIDTISKDFEIIEGPAIHGLRRRKKE